MSMKSGTTILLLLAAGCGGDSIYVYECDGGGSDGAADSTIDVADAARDVAEKDASGDAQDGGGPVFNLKCAEGSQCDGGTVCCGTLAFRQGCNLSSLTASCKVPAGCSTVLQPFCGGDETVRLCDSPSDCTEPGYDRCCNFPIGGTVNSLTMCGSAAMANAVDGGSCL